MATISELNIRLGLLTKEFERNLRKVERDLRNSGQRLSQLGSDLTLAISAPLAAIGGFSIKAAGDIEALRLAMQSTFQDAGRSIGEANKELELLRQAALAPGLDFEQAVRGSIRLQNVGFAAEEARGILVQLANAVALTGGTAIELDGVTRQFTQMIAKGRILQEDLTIIQENMPAISKAMDEAFGTRSADKLRELGITGEQFVRGITQQLSELPRVSGGIANAIVNLFAGIKNAAARFGEEINRVFNISENSDRLVAGLNSIVDAFVGLDDGTKRFIIQMTLAVAAIGPLIKVIGVLRTAQAALVGSIVTINGRMAALTGFIQRSVVAFNALSVASKAAFLGGVVTAIVLAADALGVFNRELTTAEKVQAKIADVTRRAGDAIAEEKAKVTALVGVLKDQNATREEQEKALRSLKAISPEYFGSLDLEKAKVQDIDAALDGYISQLLRAAKAQAAFDELVNIEKRLNNLKEEADPSVWQQIGNAVLSAGNTFTGMGLNASSAAKNMQALKTELEAQREALLGIVKEGGGVSETVSRAGQNFKELAADSQRSAAAQEDAAKKAKLYKDALASIAAVVQKGDVLGADVFSEQAKEIENQIERLLENGFKPYSREIENLRGMLAKLKADQQSGFSTPNSTQALLGIDPTTPTPIATLPPLTQVISVDASAANQTLEDFKVNIEGVGNTFLSAGEQINQVLTGINEGTIPLVESFDQLFQIVTAGLTPGLQSLVEIGGTLMTEMFDAIGNGTQSFATFASSAISSLGKVIQRILQAYIAQQLLNSAFFSKNPFAAIAIGAIVGAASNALFQRIAKAIKPPSLAEGGVVSSPTLALIGDAGAGNPEIVAPEAKLRQIFRQEGGGSGELRAVVRGDDLLFIVDKAANRRGRLR